MSLYRLSRGVRLPCLLTGMVSLEVMNRTGIEKQSSVRGKVSPEINKEILRLINNSRPEFMDCAMSKGRYGMEDYAKVYWMLRDLAAKDVMDYIDRIEDVRKEYFCRICEIKIVAYCAMIAHPRLPDRHRTFRLLYQTLLADWPKDSKPRDFAYEVWKSVTRKLPRKLPVEQRPIKWWLTPIS